MPDPLLSTPVDDIDANYARLKVRIPTGQTPVSAAAVIVTNTGTIVVNGVQDASGAMNATETLRLFLRGAELAMDVLDEQKDLQNELVVPIMDLPAHLRQ